MLKFFQKNYRFFCAIAILMGTIVGAGTFGIPYIMARAGFGIGLFYLFFLAGAVTLIHLCYGEVVLRTRQPHRLVGHAEKYLGPLAKVFATLVAVFEYYGSLLAYLILGGEFLRIALGRVLGGSEIFWVIVFFILGAAAIFYGLKFISGGEFFLTLFLVGAVALMIFKGWPLISRDNFFGVDWPKVFLPYGVILFAMAGSVAVPEMRQVLIGQERKLKSAILWGTLIPAALYAAFAWAVVGVSGAATSEDAISGLVPFLGPWVIIVGALFGLAAVYTSFIVLGLNLKNIYTKDYHFKESGAFFLTCLVPLAGYLLGIKSFILVIGFIGAVAASLDAILTVFIYFKAKIKGDRKPEYAVAGARIVGLSLIFIFALGLAVSLFSFFA